MENGDEDADAKSFSILDPNAKVFRNTSGDVRSVSKAIYGQVNYHLTDRLRSTGGLLYTWDSRKLVLHTRLDRDTLECAIPADQRHGPEEHPSDLQSLLRTSYAVFFLKK